MRAEAGSVQHPHEWRLHSARAQICDIREQKLIADCISSASLKCVCFIFELYSSSRTRFRNRRADTTAAADYDTKLHCYQHERLSQPDDFAKGLINS
jgi:hypothetical protein